MSEPKIKRTVGVYETPEERKRPAGIIAALLILIAVIAVITYLLMRAH